MKRFYLAMCMLAASGMAFTACGDDSPEANGQENTGSGQGGSGGGTGGGGSTGGGGGTESPYSWANMQGYWMDENYEACLSEISVYEQQNASSDVYYAQNYQAYGMQFDASGRMKELRVEMRGVKFDNAHVFKTIHTSDNKTLYWQDVENDSYTSYGYTISGNYICLGSEKQFEIRTPNALIDEFTSEVYVRAK